MNLSKIEFEIQQLRKLIVVSDHTGEAQLLFGSERITATRIMNVAARLSESVKKQRKSDAEQNRRVDDIPLLKDCAS